MTEAMENYLEVILVLSRQTDGLHAVDLATYFGYSRPTISIMLKQMKEMGLAAVDEENHIRLTQQGREIAEQIYERHQILCGLFVKRGVSKETAMEDACKVEHDLSEESFAAIKRYGEKLGVAVVPGQNLLV